MELQCKECASSCMLNSLLEQLLYKYQQAKAVTGSLGPLQAEQSQKMY